MDLDTILRQSDMLTLHMPLTDENFHLLDREAFAKMKDGVVLINTARGPLVDTNALLDALESGKVGAAGLDVVEDEVGLYHHDWKNTVIHNRFIPLLRGFNNVILTSHKAYYTDQSVSDMVRNSLLLQRRARPAQPLRGLTRFPRPGLTNRLPRRIIEPNAWGRYAQ